MHRNGLLRAAACAAVSVVGVAGVANANGVAGDARPDARLVSSDLTLSSRPVYLQAAATTRPPLMSLLHQIGVGPALDEAKINIGGVIEGSYTHSFTSPPGNLMTGRVFDIEHEDPTLNQVALFVERAVSAPDAAKSGNFDIGGRIEWRYGGDSRFIHSVGLFDHQGFGDGPDNQWDLTQAFLDFAIPVGNGLVVRVGKQVTPIGLEVIDPSGNDFFSHSFLFGYAIPFTHTGVFVTYALTDQLTINGAVTRGWDTSLEDNNGTVDFLGWVQYTVDPQTKFQVSLITGPDQPGNNDDWRTLIDVIVSTKVGDNLTLAVNADYAIEEDSVSSVAGSTAQWFGVAFYAGYEVSKQLSVNARAEYFNDDDGARLTGAVGGTSVWEATLGLEITPFPDSDLGKGLVIRPEIRMDYANKAFFDGGTDHKQFTAAIDAYYKF